tara:strand:- start:500 stop:694 length:195 start_codon:yes stop_codon:yes gene_type:complete
MKKSDKIFKQIENVRKKNNKNWMAMLKLAYDVRPKETVKILNQIIVKDAQLIKLAKILKKINAK